MHRGMCVNHPTVIASVSCASCSREFCDTCLTRSLNGEPWCEHCLHLVSSTGKGQAVAVGFALFLFSVAGVVEKFGRTHPSVELRPFWIGYSIFSIGSLLYLLFRSTTPFNGEILDRRAAKPVAGTSAPRIRPKRQNGLVQRSAVYAASPVSGVWTALLLLFSMAGSALVVPRYLQLTIWLEAEWVLLAWWFFWGGALSILLFRGWRLADDHILALPRTPWSETRRKLSGCAEQGCSGCDLPGCGEGGGLGEFLIVVTVLLFALLAAWLLVELLFPLIFFYVYYLVRTSLARVANDHHECEGERSSALRWGFLWATAYALPLALAVVLLHFAASL